MNLRRACREITCRVGFARWVNSNNGPALVLEIERVRTSTLGRASTAIWQSLSGSLSRQWQNGTSLRRLHWIAIPPLMKQLPSYMRRECCQSILSCGRTTFAPQYRTGAWKAHQSGEEKRA